MRRSFFSDRSFKFILGGLVFLFVLLIIQKAYVQPPPPPTPIYTISAHGNISYGVNRTSLNTPINFGYSIGNCAHCHEQHTSIGGDEPVPDSPVGPDYYLLFMDLWIAPPQSNEFCFGCHTSEAGSCGTGGTCQSSWGRIPDFALYSYRAGGDTSITCSGAPYSVYRSFQFVTDAGVSQPNCGSDTGSAHMLWKIRDFMANQVGFPSNTDYVNPCSACHNPHRAKRDYPCSRIKHHADLTTWNVWGDDAGTLERMGGTGGLTPNYWAPCRYPNTSGNDICESGYEPDGSSTQDGSNTPDYVNLCYDCHNPNTTIYSPRLGRNLYKINWTATGDFHGNKPRNDASMSPEYGDLLAPYKVGGSYQKTNYLLSCTDCHEPHGSRYEFLLRRTLNGNQITAITGNGQWYYWCRSCHVITKNDSMHNVPTFSCYQNAGCHRHGNTTAPM